jgi:hypothetical protein
LIRKEIVCLNNEATTSAGNIKIRKNKTILFFLFFVSPPFFDGLAFANSQDYLVKVEAVEAQIHAKKFTLNG